MGTYTRLGVNMTVRPEYRQPVANMLNAFKAPPFPRWDHLLNALLSVHDSGCLYFDGSGQPPDPPIITGLLRFLSDDRSGWVGFARVSDHTTSLGWGDINSYDPVTGSWIFTCALKNYEGTIEKFLDHVLPHLASKVQCIQAEVDPTGHVRGISNYALEDGKIVFKGDVTAATGVAGWHTDEYDTLVPAKEFQEG